MKIGIIGAGFMGRVITKLAKKVGDDVMISNSRSPETLFSVIHTLGCKGGTVKDAANFGELIFVAIPLKYYKTLPVKELEGKIIIDACNYYPERDGKIEALERGEMTTSELIAQHLPNSTVIKAFNAITATDLGKSPILENSKKRAIPIAGDDLNAKKKVAELIIKFGFEVVDVGSLADSWRFERGQAAYCVALDDEGLLGALAEGEREDLMAAKVCGI